MKESNRRFTISMIVIALLVCASIMAYFTYIAPSPEMPDLASLGKLNSSPTTGVQPQGPAGSEATTPAAGQPPKTTPSPEPPKAEFTHEHVDTPAPAAEFELKTDELSAIIPSGRLAPDMFAYDSLPFDAPLAEFPLVLVGQKYLEWAKSPTGPREGMASGVDTAPMGIYGRPPTPTPPPPPPGPSGPPVTPPPPKPPPEVSYSGL